MPELRKKHGGRKKGTPNKRTAERAAAIAAGGLTPLDYMLQVMRDPKAPSERRDEMAKAAAPYVHPRLAAIEHAGKPGAPIETKEVNLLEVARRMAFILSAGAAAAENGEEANG